MTRTLLLASAAVAIGAPAGAQAVAGADTAAISGLGIRNIGSATMALFQIPFIFNFFWSIWNGKKVDQNPWEATTLEWAAPSPPPHGNFAVVPQAYRGPYEYSVPGAGKDFTPQYEA